MHDLPTKEQILDWIRENPARSAKRDIARAFAVKGAGRIELKRLLRELEDEGHLERRRKRMRPAGDLPPVAVLRVLGADADGDLLATPADADDDAPAVRIVIIPQGRPRGGAMLGTGDRVLAKLRRTDDGEGYEARPIKKLDSGGTRTLGIFRRTPEGARLEPVEKGAAREWLIPRGQTDDAEDGELVEIEALDGPRRGLSRGRVIARHGDAAAPGQVSLIAMVQHGIAYEFSDEVLSEAKRAAPLDRPGGREDLRALPLLTIDPADARDHDDAVCAMADDDPTNPGGHVVWVAIADVAHYVQPGSALDHEARRRGNSTYFPDRVSPMLPEALSADLCSLIDGADRPCMALRVALDAQGRKRTHRFCRAVMRSRASLSYEAAQGAIDGTMTLPDEITAEALRPLFAAYAALRTAREARAPLDLELPERQIVLGDDGHVQSVEARARLDAHRLIEEMMILANVCAAETLEAARTPLLYRVHEEPSAEKMEALREMVETLDIGVTLAKGQVTQTRHFNRLLGAAVDTPFAETVQMSVLRSQMQAYYAAQNFGHFGLNLPKYAHFTSPIRRYADLIVHRALITALKAGRDGLSPEDIERLDQTAEHVSQTERRSMDAERDTVDRYLAAFLSDRIGAEFRGRISGVSRAGAFVKLSETGADGLIPISTIGSEFFRHDRDSQTLVGERSGLVLGLGMPVTVRLREAAPISGGLILELIHLEGDPVQSARGGGRGRTPRRKLGKERIRRQKAARKASR